MTTGKSYSKFITLTGIGTVFAVGYMVGLLGNQVQGNTHHNDGKPKRSPNTMMGEDQKMIGGELWETRKEQIIKRWESSTSVSTDYVLIEDTHSLISRVATEDLEKLLLELNPNPDAEYQADVHMQMQELIASSLIKRDPERLIGLLSVTLRENIYLDSDQAVYKWIEHDPLSVLAWIEKGEMPDGIRDNRDDYMESAIERLAIKHPAEFERRLEQVSPDYRESILENVAYGAVTSSMRDAILERASKSNHDDALALWRGILRSESEYQPEQAYARLGEIDLSKAEYADLDLDLMGWALSENLFTYSGPHHGYMKAWLLNNPDRDIPARMLEVFGTGYYKDRDSSMSWVTKELPAARYDAFAAITVESELRYSEPNFKEVISITDRIKDPKLRIDALRLLKKSWQEKDRVAANDWERSLSVSDQEKLE